MSTGRVFVAECMFCHTKFMESPAECPICGGASIRAIRESVPKPETIPEPSIRKTPPPKGVGASRSDGPGPKARRRVPRTPPRLDSAKVELHETTGTCFAEWRCSSASETVMRDIRAEIRCETTMDAHVTTHVKIGRDGGLHIVCKTLASG